MRISNSKALELIDEKIKQFQHILDTATYDTRYDTEYEEVYYGTEGLLKELFSEKEANNFRASVLTGFGNATADIFTEMHDYKKHISKCVSQLKVYKERIQNFREESEITEQINKNANQKANVLLVTATKVESKAVFNVFRGVTHQTPILVSIGDQIYHDIGIINGKRVFMVQSEMGSGGIGASQQTVQKGISDLSPTAVIMVGIAFGIDPKKQSIGDVLVSKQLMLYELQRVGTKDGNPKKISRGDKAPASTRLLSYFRNADLYREEPLYEVIFGLILSGEKLVDNVDFRQQLYNLEPETIGGEMEGAGLYTSCHDSGVDWIIVKAVCDWADGNKGENKESSQKLAAENAASFVLHTLQQVPFSE